MKLRSRAARRALERPHHRVLSRLQPSQAGRADDGAAPRLEIFGENRLGDLLGNAELEAVAAGGEVQIQLGEDLAVGVKPCPRVLTPAAINRSAIPSASKISSDRSCTTVARSQPCGASSASISRQGTSRRSNSAASSRPVGPAPTTSTCGLGSVMSGVRAARCASSRSTSLPVLPCSAEGTAARPRGGGIHLP